MFIFHCENKKKPKISSISGFHKQVSLYLETGRPSFQLDKLISLRTKSELLGIFEIVHAVARIDAFYKMYLAMVIRVSHRVNARTVKSHRVKRGKYAYIGH